MTRYLLHTIRELDTNKTQLNNLFNFTSISFNYFISMVINGIAESHKQKHPRLILFNLQVYLLLLLNPLLLILHSNLV